MQIFTDTIPDISDFNAIQFMRHIFNEDEIIPDKNPNHMHPFCELYFLLEGEVEFYLGKRSQWLKASRTTENGRDNRGWVVITRSGEFHGAYIRKKYYDHFYMFIDDKSLVKINNYDYPLRDFLSRGQYRDNIFQTSMDAWDKISLLIDKMTNLARSDCPLKEFDEFAAAVELITIVSREWSRVFAVESSEPEPTVAEKIRISSPIVQRALSYIDDNFRSLESVAAVAESCGVSQSYLSRIFREQIGQRPSEYLRRKRIEYAKTMLLNGYDVTRVCYHAGFGDYSHFIQVFHKYEGTTPLAFQQTHGVMRNDYHITPD